MMHPTNVPRIVVDSFDNAERSRQLSALMQSLDGEVLPSRDLYIENKDNYQYRLSNEQLLRGSHSQKEAPRLMLPTDLGFGGKTNLPSDDDGPDRKDQGEGQPHPRANSGWFKHVFMPCFFAMLGVVPFLRLPWIIHLAGLIESFFLLVLSVGVISVSLPALLAVISCDQMHRTGLYFKLSRALGAKIGGTVGVVLFLALTVGLSMFIFAFAESVIDMLRELTNGFAGIIDSKVRANDSRMVASVTLIFLMGFSLLKLSCGFRIQFLLFLLLVAAHLNFFVGTFLDRDNLPDGVTSFNSRAFEENLFSNYTMITIPGTAHPFFSSMAFILPAFISITSGVGVAGRTRLSSTAVMKGMTVATIASFFVHLTYSILIAGSTFRVQKQDTDFGADSDAILLQDQVVFSALSGWPLLSFIACFVATMLAAGKVMASAPRLMQAMWLDDLLPGSSFIYTKLGLREEKWHFHVITFVIALACVNIGDLNFIMTLTSVLFCVALAALNFSVAYAEQYKPSGWSPSFRFFNKGLAIAAGVACTIVSLLLNCIVAFMAMLVLIVLYWLISSKSLSVNYGFSGHSKLFAEAVKTLFQLERVVDENLRMQPKVMCVCGNPSQRPLLVDFANLLTEGQSLLQCIQVVAPEENLNKVHICLNQGHVWFEKKHIAGFFHVTRAASLEQGVRQAVELCGLGRLKPNMLLLGFKSRWLDDMTATQQYMQAIIMALENEMNLGVLKIRGGLDASEVREPPSYKSKAGEKDHDKAALRAFALSVAKHSGPMQSNVKEIPSFMHQFQAKETKEGFIDVYWLYDDGGFTMLLPHSLRSHPMFSRCPLRVFFLTKRVTGIELERHKLREMLKQFRFLVDKVEILDDMTKPPSANTRDEFNDLLKAANKAATAQGVATLTMSTLLVNKERTEIHLRLAEIVKEKSQDSAMIFMTLPVPFLEKVPTALYMSWLDLVSSQSPAPFLFIRGNQQSLFKISG